jgi:KDO2-lipid IV(A) lauroyltransferase
MKTTRYLFEAAVVYILMTIFKILPAERASALGGWIGRNVAYRFSVTRKAKRHIEKSLHTNAIETDRIAKGMWDNLGRLFAEYPHLPELCLTRSELVGVENLGDLPTTPNVPAIFFSGHLANWEIVAPCMRQQNIDGDLIYRPPNNAYVKKLLDQCRSMDGTLRTYPKSHQGMRQVARALKDGRRIGILIDQKYNTGVEVPFFGQPAMTSLAFIQLAKRFKCPLIPVQVERLDNTAKFRVTIHKPMDLSKDDNTLITEAHDLLESWIKSTPEHWLWLHKRWKIVKES